jgi:P-type Ca2+ transporter type 2C
MGLAALGEMTLPGKAWHQLEFSEALTSLGVDAALGLPDAEVKKRQRQFGPNELIERGQKSGWKILQDQLTSTFVVILILAGIISMTLGDKKDAVAVFAIVLLNTVLGFAQEFRAEKAMTALKKMAVPVAVVRRNGKTQHVRGPDLVPGDIVSLEAGNIVPADCRLVETRNLLVQESALTGEAEPVEKQTGPLEAKDLAIADRSNIIYAGTFVTYGRAVAVVIQTGMRTELGRIADLLTTVKRQPTPLQRRLDQLAHHLAIVAVVLVGIVFVIGLVLGENLKLLFFTAISLLVAAVPEGLPAVVTITLALGTQRMLRRHALVRKLSAVETLGSVSVICSDKTGTLTENRMTVAMLEVAGHRLSIPDSEALQPPSDAGHALLLLGAMLCNDAVLERGDSGSPGEIRAIGDPTEAAIVVAAAILGLRKPLFDGAFPRVDEAPFESSRKRMTTVHQIQPHQVRLIDAQYPPLHSALSALGVGNDTSVRNLAFTKGAVEAVLDRCTHVWADDHLEMLTPNWRDRFARTNDEFAQTGMRVLGIAVRLLTGEAIPTEADALEQSLTFIGMLGLSDPTRDGVKSAIETCRAAGVRIVMITGDHPATARRVAQELNISHDGKLLTGQELSKLSLKELAGVVEDVSIYARVSPEHKLKIVEALEQRGHVVAMTGDGVNDAPALKKANIGVTMGVAGSDVAKEAGDMVLLDDNFTTIVAAVEEGRVIYDNLRKFIKYALGGNVGEILVMLLAPLAGMPLPLLPLQILWVNLITDGLPGLALAVEPAERDTMRRPPYGIQEGIFSERMGRQIIWIGVIIGLVSLALGYWYWHEGRPEWQTIVFTTLTLSQMANALAVRSSKDSLFRIGLFSNVQLLAVVSLNCLLQIALIYLPVFQSVFSTRPLRFLDLVLVLLWSTSVFWIVELQKYWTRREIG